MRLAILIAAAVSLLGGAAAACPAYDECPRRDRHDHGYHHRWSDEGRYHEHGYWEERGGYGHEERYWEDRRAGCRDACGEVSLPASFFFDAGGVGPIPDTGFVGGGFVFADSFAGSRASAFASARAHASASASAQVSVRFRGGFKGRHGGHKGGKH